MSKPHEPVLTVDDLETLDRAEVLEGYRAGLAGDPEPGDNRSRSYVQVRNPINDRWVKIDTKTGRIVDTKKSPGPYRGIPRG